MVKVSAGPRRLKSGQAIGAGRCAHHEGNERDGWRLRQCRRAKGDPSGPGLGGAAVGEQRGGLRGPA